MMFIKYCLCELNFTYDFKTRLHVITGLALYLPLKRLLAIAPHGAIGLVKVEFISTVLNGAQSSSKLLASLE